MNRHAAYISLVFLLLLVSPVFAQFETADVLGTIRDPSGAPVARASVTLLNQDTGAIVKATPDDGGNFTFTNVRVGKYTVTAEAPGFSKAIAANIQVDVGARSGWI